MIHVIPVKTTKVLSMMQIIPKKKNFFSMLVGVTLYMALLVRVSKIAMLHKKVREMNN